MKTIVSVLLALLFIIFADAFYVQCFAKNKQASDHQEVIGKWREDDVPSISATLEIYKQNGKYFLKQKFDKDGSSFTHELQKEKTKKGKLQFRSVKQPGDYFVITKDNLLESWDKSGLICTDKPIK